MRDQTAGREAWVSTPTCRVEVGGVPFAYRALGSGPPLVLLHHLAAVLDNWDPRVVDGLAAARRVIAFDNRGVGGSAGQTPDTIEEMADDAAAFIRVLELGQVDILGLSMGGFVAQAIMKRNPELVRKVILAGTGPAGGQGIDQVARITLLATVKAKLTGRDPKEYLFFTRSPSGQRAAREFIGRLRERTSDRDRTIGIRSFRAQLRAISRWGEQDAWDLSDLPHETLVANGDRDLMVPSPNSVALAEQLPHGQLEPLYHDAGHGEIFQNHTLFVPAALAFLDRAVS